MVIKLETQSIRAIAAFEKLTGVHAKDCIVTDDCVYFLVEPKKIGAAVGRNGNNIKEARKVFGRQVKVFGYYDGLEDMLKSLIPSVKSIEINDSSVTVTVPSEHKTSVIGRNGNNIKVIRQILDRHFFVKKFRLR
ncbi:MAG: NusA-like transcription termination signal-binding factor [Candidatus Aenigmatarchaeota archaeon]|nr:MAG: NusA-like transcription termination signal-binding factor [Candidatus Aenigmarchaeota archaeon]